MPIMPTTKTMPQPCVEPCPACGGLQCLCRPRFFAGQLLTEEDLNRLERYIVEKNKLHNRYLHGWGVVCGLEVSCHPCQGYVTVKSGYALSPCGDDIVVCQDEAVNVCELIKKCRDDAQRQWDCDPPWPRPEPDCGNENEPWVLYLCYAEQPSRGVTALRGASGGACCSRCSCGGSSGCGCECHEKKHSHGNGNVCKTPKPKTLAQCEPTLTCEGYTFQLRKVPALYVNPPGALAARLTECVTDLVMIQQAAKAPAVKFNEIKTAMIEFLDRHAIHDCTLEQKISELVPSQTPQKGVMLRNLRMLLQELLRECLCSALLPPCPEPVEENCVPIAAITVNCRDGCRVVRVCDWERRRIVVTFPNLEYWFGPLLHQSGRAELLARFCCAPQGEAPDVIDLAGLLDDAAKKPGQVDAQFIYDKVSEVLKKLL